MKQYVVTYSTKTQPTQMVTNVVFANTAQDAVDRALTTGEEQEIATLTYTEIEQVLFA